MQRVIGTAGNTAPKLSPVRGCPAPVPLPTSFPSHFIPLQVIHRAHYKPELGCRSFQEACRTLTPWDLN